MRTTFLSLVAAACFGLSVPAAAQGNDDQTVKITVEPGAIADAIAIKVDKPRLVFQRRKPGRITWDIDTSEYEFDNDASKLGIVIYELRTEGERPDKNRRGRADNEFRCRPIAGGRQFRCDNLNTAPGIYFYDIRLKERTTGRRRSVDPVIVNL